jgi:hypothetical protein
MSKLQHLEIKTYKALEGVFHVLIIRDKETNELVDKFECRSVYELSDKLNELFIDFRQQPFIFTKEK